MGVSLAESEKSSAVSLNLNLPVSNSETLRYM